MTSIPSPFGSRSSTQQLRILAEQAFSRAAGAPLVAGNSARVLKDADENFPAWLDAIAVAQRTIFFEHYIVADDEIGRQFVAALAERARAGVRVMALYDWFGGLGTSSARLWRPLLDAGGQVRRFNPPRLESPFGWLTRDHRKLIAVDGEVGFVGGLCVSHKWVGDPARGIEAWRDTGLEVRGPAVADFEDAFSQVWSATGAPLDAKVFTPAASMKPRGDVTLRVLATVPSIAGLYRLDQLIAAMATRTLWLTDAYFLGIAPYVQALRAAALDGVDVRLLVPGASDLPYISRMSRAGYRSLLEAGIRVFEWNGPMLHAKTAVADGRWARVGSTNLNLASWVGNYELDVAIEDTAVAGAMAELYLSDLEHSTEIVLGPRSRVRAAPPGRRRQRRRGTGSAVRAAAGALRLSHTVGAAITNRRVLGRTEAGTMAAVGAALLALTAVVVLWPLVLAVPIALLAGWMGIALMIRALGLYRRPRGDEVGSAKPRAGTPHAAPKEEKVP
ncbi:MAG TPA: phospholipase D-like domain-containing protein [Burkholderiales bacterium]|nr:phospholipase D-like domain-containing protein [Burkholderiales bacterium]